MTLTWFPTPTSPFGDLTAGVLWASSPTSLGHFSRTGLGTGGSCRDHQPSSTGGHHSGFSGRPTSCLTSRHRRSWITTARCSGGFMLCMGPRHGLLFTLPTSACAPSSLSASGGMLNAIMITLWRHLPPPVSTWPSLGTQFSGPPSPTRSGGTRTCTAQRCFTLPESRAPQSPSPTAQSSSWMSGAITGQGHAAGRAGPGHVPQSSVGDDDYSYTKKGNRLCQAYNSSSGCGKGGNCKDHHSCKKCRKPGHGSANCYLDSGGRVSLKPNPRPPAPPPPSASGQRKGGRGKGGGRRG